MRVLAIYDERYAAATVKVVGQGATLLSAPPYVAREMTPARLERYDVLYLDLHGQPGSVYLYYGAPALQAALHVDTIRQANLAGAVVFATTCYLPATPFLHAFLQAGARAVIAGEGVNYAGRTRLAGAQLLARLVLRRLERGQAVEQALAEGLQVMRANLRLRLFERQATEDTLGFKVYRNLTPLRGRRN